MVAATLAGLVTLMFASGAPLFGLVIATLTPVTPVLVAITAKPMLAESEAPPTEADAETVVAPAAAGLAARISIDATPDASVRAVPEAGIIVASAVEVAKVTTLLGTTAPTESRTVAVTLAGLPLLIFTIDAPLPGLVSVRLIPVTPVLVASTANPALPETGDPLSVASAVMVVAPAAVRLAASIWMAATPEASVSAVPDAGVMVASVAVVVKVTTVPETTAPLLSLTVADTLAGLPALMFVSVAPVAGSVKAIDTLAELVVVTTGAPPPGRQPVSPRTLPSINFR
jgi:hypothetical protein